ncbi:MAG TPA: DUF1501 domain-containing protein [Bryobacteraceae bacterium]|nr:DUF1501 domain-containing protein [Bryobacteraceae bacterium]
MSVNNRRDFIRSGGLALGGLHLSKLLAAEEQKTERSCIVIFQNGGSSQLDSFDPKPEAPSDIRGSFGAISSSVPGVPVSGLLPRTAKIMHRIAVIRSMRSDEAIHERARQYIFSGTKPRNDLIQPSFGAVMAKERGGRNGLPPFVVIPESDLSAEAGFLGPSFDPFVAGNPNQKTFTVRDLTLPSGVTHEEAFARKRLLAKLDAGFREAENSPLLDTMDEFYGKAYDLISSPAARKAFDIQNEPDQLRDAYGRTGIGQGCLLARRLIESGVRLATVYHGGYDTHTDHEKSTKPLLTDFDQAFPTLLDDLAQRGLLSQTLVVVIGDFGRTPKVNFSGGRDHWPSAFSVVLAGANIPGGAIIGRTDKQAGEPVDRPVTIEDLAATVYRSLGIDFNKDYHANGRPVRIVKDGIPLKELVS